MNRDFKGIWIPKEIWLNKDLKIMEKIMLVEIDSLDNKENCFASNKYFSVFFGISNGRVSQIINSLKDKKYISIKYEYEGKEVKKRIIKVFNKLKGYLENDEVGIKNIKEGYLENDEDNNTDLNNTKKNNINDPIKTELEKYVLNEYLDFYLIIHKIEPNITKTTKKDIKSFANQCYKNNDKDFEKTKEFIYNYFCVMRLQTETFPEGYQPIFSMKKALERWDRVAPDVLRYASGKLKSYSKKNNLQNNIAEALGLNER